MSTGERELHEAKGRGPPGKWEWQSAWGPEEEAKGFFRGGDVLGQLLMRVRDVIISFRARGLFATM